MSTSYWAIVALICIAAITSTHCFAAPAKNLIDVSAASSVSRLTPTPGSEGQAAVSLSTDHAAPGLVVAITPGESRYPGVALKPDGGAAVWDLSAYGHIDARVTNTGETQLRIGVRVDNAGDWRDNPWSSEVDSIGPGETKTITVIFGYSWHQIGYQLKTNAITQILLYADKPAGPGSLRIDSLVAAGSHGEGIPEAMRTKPDNGVILGSNVAIDASTQIDQHGAQASPAAGGHALTVAFAAGTGGDWVSLKPSVGKWDLRLANEVRVRIKNIGEAPATPSIQATSGGNGTDTISAPNALAPGGETEIVAPFQPSTAWKGIPNSGDRTSWNGQPGTGTRFASDEVDSIKLMATCSAPAKLLIESIVADAPPAKMPDWLGKRPPAAGDWVMTFDDEFDGKAIDQTKWNIYGPNYWDADTHWSKDNLVLVGGLATLHFEKKTGFQNDDPKQMLDMTSPRVNSSDYSCGFLESYDKWSQRYGYFEARLKLPTAPGLWPTFWMMPDRGPAAGQRWQREDTAIGGMEFDIMEHLDRWGPYRYNIAMHWDGYGANQHQTGSQFTYVERDKDGFMTVGLLWTPGSAIYYCNGKEVLRWEDPRIACVPEHFIIEMTTGGWDNDKVDESKLPADYSIDYVRVWQRKDLASAADSPPNLNK